MRKSILGHGVLATLGLIVLAGLVPAQPVVDQLVLTADDGRNPGLYYALMNMNPPILRKQASTRFESVMMAHWNQDLVATEGFGNQVYTVDSSGKVTRTLTGIPNIPWPSSFAKRLECDQDGSYVITCGSYIYRLSGSSLSTLNLTNNHHLTCITRDQDTGNFVLGSAGGTLLRMDRVTGALSTMTGSFGTITGVAYNPVNGSLVVARDDPEWGLIIVHRSGFSWRIRFTRPTCVTVDPIRGYVYAANRFGEVIHTTATGQVIKQTDFGDYVFEGIGIWGSRRVSMVASGYTGTKQNVHARFHLSPGLRYQCALSFGSRPGIAVDPVRTLFLHPDALFFATLFYNIPGVTHYFNGVTSSTGTAYPAFTIPASVPKGTRIYFGMAVVNAVYSGGLDVSNVECIKVR